MRTKRSFQKGVNYTLLRATLTGEILSRSAIKKQTPYTCLNRVFQIPKIQQAPNSERAITPSCFSVCVVMPVNSMET